jgi:hypothetical protein
MKLETRIRQSAAAARSGIRLVMFLAFCSAGALLLGARALAEISGVLALFFTAVALLEYWNAWRFKRRVRKQG